MCILICMLTFSLSLSLSLFLHSSLYFLPLSLFLSSLPLSLSPLAFLFLLLPSLSLPFLTSSTPHRYLEQCILALDLSNEVTKSHMATVISQLSQQLALLEKTFEANPTATKPPIKKSVKRLKMLSERLCQPQ